MFIKEAVNQIASNPGKMIDTSRLSCSLRICFKATGRGTEFKYPTTINVLMVEGQRKMHSLTAQHRSKLKPYTQAVVNLDIGWQGVQVKPRWPTPNNQVEEEK